MLLTVDLCSWNAGAFHGDVAAAPRGLAPTPHSTVWGWKQAFLQAALSSPPAVPGPWPAAGNALPVSDSCHLEPSSQGKHQPQMPYFRLRAPSLQRISFLKMN